MQKDVVGAIVQGETRQFLAEKSSKSYWILRNYHWLRKPLS